MNGVDNSHVEQAYARWAPVYDLVFAHVMKPGRKALAAAASRPGTRVLDVGVGTGLELPMFDPATRLVGIDLSEPMLRVAARRVAREKLANVEGLLTMDATRLAFPDGAFDRVVAPYVITVVPDPHGALDEMARVTKPGGEIVLVNHIGAEKGFIAACENWLARRADKLGWNPQFSFDVIGDWISARPGLRLTERRPLAPLGLFSLIRIAKG